MAISLKGTGEFTWPADLLPKTHEKANKKKELDDLMGMLDIASKQFTAIGNFPFPPSKGTAAAAQRYAKLAEDFFKGGPYTKLLGSLKVVAKRCETMEKGKPGKDAAKALKAIKAAASGFVDEGDAKVHMAQVAKIVEALVAADREATLKGLAGIFKSFKAASAKGHPGLKTAAAAMKTWADSPEAQVEVRKTVNSSLTNVCRDMTQNLQNIVKAMGYDDSAVTIPDRAKKVIPNLAKTLIPYANSEGSFTKDLDEDQLKQLIKTIAAQAQLYDRVAGDLP